MAEDRLATRQLRVKQAKEEPPEARRQVGTIVNIGAVREAKALTKPRAKGKLRSPSSN